MAYTTMTVVGLTRSKPLFHRLKERDPNGERTQWRKCSEITNYACAREMAEMVVEGNTIRLDLAGMCSLTSLSV